MYAEITKESGLRVFFRTNEEEYFECFTDGEKKEVGKAWLLEKFKNNRKYGFKAIILGEEHIKHLKKLMKDKNWKQVHRDSGIIDLEYRYGLITDEEYKQYQQL